MSINSTVIDLHMLAHPTSTERSNVIAVTRQLVRRHRWSQERPYLKIGDSYRIPDPRRGYDGASNWVHLHH